MSTDVANVFKLVTPYKIVMMTVVANAFFGEERALSHRLSVDVAL